MSAVNAGSITYTGKMNTIKALREKFVNRPALVDKQWVLDVPYDVRDGAVREFVQNLGTELGKRKKNPDHYFSLKYKSRIDSTMSIPILKKHWKERIWFPSQKMGKICGYEHLPDALLYDSKMVKTRFNTFYMCIPQERQVHRVENRSDVIALDPGVRTFLTGYDPSGKVLHIGQDDANKVFQMCRVVDKLMAKVSASKNHKQRYQRKRAASRLREKIRHRIRDLHHKTAKFLCTSYNIVLLPSFDTKQMVRRANRKLHTKTARMMMTFSHYSFKLTLLDKARDYGTKVYIVNEAYTSKTCTRCGYIKSNLGGAKAFRCDSCNLCIDRDVNGARNILIRSTEAVG